MMHGNNNYNMNENCKHFQTHTRVTNTMKLFVFRYLIYVYLSGTDLIVLLIRTECLCNCTYLKLPIRNPRDELNCFFLCLFYDYI